MPDPFIEKAVAPPGKNSRPLDIRISHAQRQSKSAQFIRQLKHPLPVFNFRLTPSFSPGNLTATRRNASRKMWVFAQAFLRKHQKRRSNERLSMITKSLGLWFSLATLAFTTLFGAGCATNGRQILLKEYGPSIPAADLTDLHGVTVCIEHIDSATNLVDLKPTTKPEEPENFKYVDRTREQDKQWDTEQKALRKQKKKKTELVEIGNLRNGFGMVMSHVYVYNDPAGWIAEGLKYDLEQQGAKVVSPAEASAADVRLSGTLQLCRVDMYMTESADMLVDVNVIPKQGDPIHRQIHTHGATGAMLASEGEYFHALRDAREKFSIFVSREIAHAVKPQPPEKDSARVGK
jgi:hypothetical protein